jgi:hypothetical protein
MIPDIRPVQDPMIPACAAHRAIRARVYSCCAAILLSMAALNAPQARAQATVNWTNSAQTPATGPGPQSVVAGDFNGDGIADIATGNTGNVSLLLGKGDGTFAAANNIAGPSGTLAIAAAAFRTGKPDDIILVSNSASNTNNAAAIFSDGSGGVTTAFPFSLPAGSASAVATGDFLGSGNQGFAVTFQQANQVAVFPGNGDGTFKQQKTTATGNAPVSVVVGNFGGVGNRDLAVANSGDNTVFVLLGNGDGTFKAPTILSVGKSPSALAVADFNGDGQMDLAVTNKGDNTVTVLLGNGAGSFGTPKTMAVGNGPSGITAGDFDGDGKMDLAVTNKTDNTVTVLLGNGDGTFAVQPTLATGHGPASVAAGIFDGSSNMGTDLAVANSADSTLTILLSQSTGTPAPSPTPIPTPTPTPTGGGGGGGANGSARLINISTRAEVGTGANILIPGFVISGSGTETLLIRADGPALTGFGVAGALAQPSLSVFNSAGTVVASNTGWGTNANADPAQIAGAAADVGAFALASGSADCALIARLPAGAYTVQVSGVGNSTGVALAEVYELSSGGTRLANISTRALVGTGANIIIPGFVIAGTGSEQLLARGDGPALTAFGVSGALAQPSLSVFDSTGSVIATNAGWGTGSNPAGITSAGASVGAFALASGSADSALVVNVSAGAYTMQLSGVNNSTGVALAEVYEVP